LSCHVSVNAHFALPTSISAAQELANSEDRQKQFKSFPKDYPENVKRIIGEIGRYHQEIPLFKISQTKDVFLKTVSVYLARNPQQQHDPTLIHMAGLFVYVYHDSPSELYFCFEALMDRLGFSDPNNHNRALSDFMNAFRMSMPELYHHFEDEEVDARDWALSWMKSVLAVELPLPCAMRLWDTYFAYHEDGFALHPYVCLAILRYLREDLQDYERDEIIHRLRHLPELDIDMVCAEGVDGCL
ncbi:hypothetical protein SARC_13242, partial [Sphaeroforma arctica JP610]